jgi:hypothetical protein
MFKKEVKENIKVVCRGIKLLAGAVTYANFEFCAAFFVVKRACIV